MVGRCDRSADLFFIIVSVREVDWWLALNSSVRHSMVALSMSHGDSMVALSMSHGDLMHCNHQSNLPVGKKERCSNRMILVLLSIMHTHTASAFILHCAHLVHPAQQSLKAHHVNAPLINDFCSSFFGCECAQMKLITTAWHPKPCHKLVVSNATNSFKPVMHSVPQCLWCLVLRSECQLDYQIPTNKRAMSKVAFGHHTFKFWIAATQKHAQGAIRHKIMAIV